MPGAISGVLRCLDRSEVHCYSHAILNGEDPRDTRRVETKILHEDLGRGSSRHCITYLLPFHVERYRPGCVMNSHIAGQLKTDRLPLCIAVGYALHAG